MDTEELFQSFIGSISEDAENIMPNDSNAELQYSQTYNVRIPKPQDKVVLDAYSVKKIREECQKAKEVKFSYAEVLLGIASLLIGAFLSAILSKVSYELKFLSVFFYTICPMGGVGAGIAYWFCRKKDTTDIKMLAEKIEGLIVDYDETEGME